MEEQKAAGPWGMVVEIAASLAADTLDQLSAPDMTAGRTQVGGDNAVPRRQVASKLQTRHTTPETFPCQ